MHFLFLIVLVLINSGCSIEASLLDGSSGSTTNPRPPVVEKTSAPTVCVNGEFGPPLLLGDGDYLVAGAFTQIGECGFNIYGSSLGNVTGKLNVNGSLTKTLPDGQGGYYITGEFSAVNGVAVPGLARINADGSLNKSFKAFGNMPAGVSGTENLTLALASGKLFVAGPFSSISNPYGSIVDPVTGVSKWPSGKRFEDLVAAATSDGNGGLYIAVEGPYQGAMRGSVIHLDQNGQIDESFHSVVGGSIKVLTYDQASNILYAGGVGLWNGSVFMKSVLAMNGSSGAAVSAWVPPIDGTPTAIVVSPTHVYVTRVNSYNSPEAGLMALNKTDGSVVWQVSTSIRSGFYGLAYDGSKLYGVGAFTKVGAVSRTGIAVFDENGNLLSSPAAVPTSEVSSVLYAGGYIYIGGYFNNVGGTTAYGLARYNASDLTLDTTWTPNAVNGDDLMTVRGLVHDGADTLYVYGDFSAIGGKARTAVAAISTTGAGAVKDWDVALAAGGADDIVQAVALGGGGVFVGGKFQSIGTAVVQGLAVLDSETGDAASFDAKVSGGNIASMDISQDGTKLYIGGDFVSVQGQTRNGLASLTVADNLLTPWAPIVSRGTFDEVYFVQEYGGIAYIYGYFSEPVGVNLQNRDSFAAIDQTGNVISWMPTVTDPNTVNDFVIEDGILYILGRLGDPQNPNVAAYNLKAGGSLLPLGQSFTAHSPRSPVVYNGAVYIADGISLLKLESDGTATEVHAYSGIIGSLSVSGGHLFVAADDLGGPDRKGLAIVNFDKAQIADWSSSVNATEEFRDVYAAQRAGDYLYISGRGYDEFGALAGKLAVINMKTNVSQIMAVSGRIDSMAAAGNTVYLTGEFEEINAEARLSLASISNGQLTNWQPQLNGPAQMAQLHQGVVYVSGEFDNVNGEERKGLAGFSSSTGDLLALNPFAGYDYAAVGRFMASGDKVYMSYEAEKDGEYEEGIITVQSATMQVANWTIPEDMDYYENWTMSDGRLFYYDIDSWDVRVRDMASGQLVSVPWELSAENLQIVKDRVCWSSGESGLLFVMDGTTGKATMGFQKVQGPPGGVE
ncbi:delta-60 repeat domain-containing protein [Bdellovibrio bacteriovorus]|uniref:delta-60 repeat domain-containing protein n=1 Tax=Bdellovibrio bacteriovorus TaxID=959 RepID=UPI0021CE05F7|nr:delta-60 repeat domain-containing protein [Bdellovibrio bacteriovorus]UXR65065.1 delta-60 repeat domain-containing protein [Bdellovibrio bacteriovorus]